jgi:hypothetical protein
VPGSRQRQWASYAILSRLVLIERLWRLYTSQVVILQVVASVELTILMPGTVVLHSSKKINLGVWKFKVTRLSVSLPVAHAGYIQRYRQSGHLKINNSNNYY